MEPHWYETPQNVIGLIRDGITGEQTIDSKNSTVFYYDKGTETEMVPVTKEED